MVNPAQYVNEVIRELKKVSWPSRNRTLDMTLLVVVVSVLVGAYIGAIDFVLQRIMTYII